MRARGVPAAQLTSAMPALADASSERGDSGCCWPHSVCCSNAPPKPLPVHVSPCGIALTMLAAGAAPVRVLPAREVPALDSIMPLLRDSAEDLLLAMRSGPGDSSAYGDTRVLHGAAH